MSAEPPSIGWLEGIGAALTTLVGGDLAMTDTAGKALWGTPTPNGQREPLILQAEQAPIGYLVSGTVDRGRLAAACSLLSALLRSRWSQQSDDAQESLQMLYQAERLAAVGQLAAGMAHEINNPLSFVRSNLATFEKYLARFAELRKRLPVDEADWRALDLDFLIEDGADLLRDSTTGLSRIARIVADLRAFSGVDRTAAQFVDINESLREAAGMAEQHWPPDVDIRLDLQPLPSIVCLPGSITQLFLSLIRNAAQAVVETGRRGEVIVSSAVGETGIVVRVHDTGVGMSREQIDHAFEPFYTTRPVGAGMGLGLATARNVVLAHGGTIALDSQPGTGTTAVVSFPIPSWSNIPRR